MTDDGGERVPEQWPEVGSRTESADAFFNTTLIFELSV